MKVRVFPSRVNASVAVPPSKSMSHRAIICACLATGESKLAPVLYSKDIEATIGGMRALGANITQQGDTLYIKGVGRPSANTPFSVDCNESGSTLRFLIPLLSLAGQRVTLTGSPRLLERPQSVYERLFAEQGVSFTANAQGVTIDGILKAGEYQLDGNVSSQFITGLLLSLPLLAGDSVIKIRPPFESRSYVELTLQAMADFGVTAVFLDEDTLAIRGGQQYRACDYKVEGDYSQMAFFAVMGGINGSVCCQNMRTDSKQGDREIVEILTRFGGDILFDPQGCTIGKAALHGSNIDLSNCPDLGPVLTVLAAFAEGTTTIYNAGRLRIKESDRIDAMESELRKLGVAITSTQDSITIAGRADMTGEVTVFGHNDHRIAMSLAVFAVCGEYPIVIEGAECVEKSYPHFFADLRAMGLKLEELD